MGRRTPKALTNGRLRGEGMDMRVGMQGTHHKKRRHTHQKKKREKKVAQHRVKSSDSARLLLPFLFFCVPYPISKLSGTLKIYKKNIQFEFFYACLVSRTQLEFNSVPMVRRLFLKPRIPSEALSDEAF